MSSIFYRFLLCLLVASAVTGCIKKRGCTDPYADNFDPEAKQDDDTCIHKREKFIGTYVCNGTLQPGPDTLYPIDDIIVNITDSTTEGDEQLIFTIENFDRPQYAIDANVVGTYGFQFPRQEIVANFDYFGEGEVSGRVLTFDITRIEEIQLPDETFTNDTVWLHLYGLKELED